MSLVNDFVWQGRTDTEDGELGERWHQHITASEIENCDAVLLGFGCDLGVANNKGRTGAKKGPHSIRTALSSFAWHTPARLADAGTLNSNTVLTSAQLAFAKEVTEHLHNKRFVIGLGGGHEIAWASYQGIRNANSGNIGIINIDAHFDLRSPAPKTSSGTPFFQIYQDCQQRQQVFNYACIGVAETANTKALFERAKQTNTRYVLDKHCRLEHITDTLAPMLEQIDTLYLTVCLDAFNAAIAPGVSAPSTLGIGFDVVLQLIEWLGQQTRQRNIDWALADIAEMNPDFDVDNRTAKLAARLVYDIMAARFPE